MSNQLYTIGHSTHSIDKLISLLEQHKIEVVCDVRSHPYSQRNPQFNRETLKQDLKAHGIKYGFFGKELGARSDNPACYIDGRVQYNYLAEEPLFIEGLNRIRNGMKEFRLALMCAEKDPLTCHRTILVCRELKADDLEIKHILADGSIETQTEAEGRLMKMHGIEADMFRPLSESIEAAYAKQAYEIAYVKPEQRDKSQP